MQRIILIVLSFLFYTLSFPPLKIFPFAFFSIFILLLALKDLDKKKIFFLTFIYFYAFWLIHTHWILNMEVDPSTKPWLVAGLFVLPAYLAIYNVIPFLSIKSKFRWILFPALWILFEFIRGASFTGFPWLNIAYTQLENPYFRMLNSIGGIYFTGTLILLSNSFLFELWQTGKKYYLIAFTFLILITHLLGAGLYYKKFPEENKIKVLIFQPNILPRQEDDYEEWMEVYKSYGNLLKEAKDTFDFVLLPESALPGYFRYSLKSKTIIDSLSKITNSPVLFGSADAQFSNGERKIYNTAFLFYNGDIIDQYNKIHLVPFGEWIPFENKIKILQKIEFGQGDFSPGDSVVILKTKKDTPFGTLICFESIFPYISREYAKKDAGFLVNITSDGWYGKSIGPVEHFEHLRFRAIETNKYVVRSAKTGISAVIDPKGRVLKSLPLFEWGIIADSVGICYKKTPYVKIGDFIIIINLIIILGFLVLSKRRN